MRMWQYDVNGFVVDPEGYEPQANPVRPESPLIRPDSTTQKPPVAGENQVVTFADGRWTIRGDYRGTKYWLPDGTKHEITSLDQAPPRGHLTEPPPPNN